VLLLKRVAPWLLVAIVVIALDQLSKWLVQQHVAYGESIPVTSFFDLVLVFNPGAAFSFLSSASGWQRELFIGIALVASIFIVYLMLKHTHKKVFCFGLAMILGGAIGNLVDRFMLGAVVDFLHFHVAQYYWPAFNLADSAITCGAALLIWDSFFDRTVQPAHTPVRGEK
jgi:signal peptidase II